MTIRLFKKRFAVTVFVPVIKVRKGKTYNITKASSAKVSRIPKEYFPLRLIDNERGGMIK